MQINKDWLSFTAVCLMFAAMLYGIVLLTRSEIREYQREGTPVTAQVVGKRSYRGAGQNGTQEYYLDVTYLTRAEESEQETEVDLQTGEFTLAPISVGSFQRAEAEVGAQTYRRISEGDSVEILYLADSLDEVRLADWVYNFNSVPMNVMLGACLLGALYCWVRAFWPSG